MTLPAALQLMDSVLCCRLICLLSLSPSSFSIAQYSVLSYLSTLQLNLYLIFVIMLWSFSSLLSHSQNSFSHTFLLYLVLLFFASYPSAWPTHPKVLPLLFLSYRLLYWIQGHVWTFWCSLQNTQQNWIEYTLLFYSGLGVLQQQWPLKDVTIFSSALVNFICN